MVLVLAPTSRFCTQFRWSQIFHSSAFLTPEICISYSKTLPLGGQCENKAALMFEIILIFTISLDLFAWQDVGDCNWRICHILCSNFTSFCVNHQNTNALYCDENVDSSGKDFLFILAIYCIALQ